VTSDEQVRLRCTNCDSTGKMPVDQDRQDAYLPTANRAEECGRAGRSSSNKV